MSELRLDLDFACCECEEAISVTVACKGKGLKAGPRTVAAVKVPCPFCGGISQVCFHPTGTVVDVQPVEQCRYLLTPSNN